MKAHRLAAILLVVSCGAAASPRIDYMLNCMGCHLADGSGAPGKVPSFGEHLAPLLRAPGGREFLVQVPGSAHSPLSDQQLAAVLNWIVANFAASRVPDFRSYTGDEVAEYRRQALVDVPARRAELLNNVGPAPPAAR